jgi:hypothetical protein
MGRNCGGRAFSGRHDSLAPGGGAWKTGFFLPQQFSSDTAPPIVSSQSKVEDRALTGAAPTKMLLATDGASMHFVPGASVLIPPTADSGQPHEMACDAFYMDETPVTYHQCVEFRGVRSLNASGAKAR